MAFHLSTDIIVTSTNIMCWQYLVPTYCLVIIMSLIQNQFQNSCNYLGLHRYGIVSITRVSTLLKRNKNQFINSSSTRASLIMLLTGWLRKTYSTHSDIVPIILCLFLSTSVVTKLPYLNCINYVVYSLVFTSYFSWNRVEIVVVFLGGCYVFVCCRFQCLFLLFW